MERIYFDNNASAPLLAEARAAMEAGLEGTYANPSSIHHFGQAAKAVLERARGQVAELIGARPAEIVFTSGGTEADNLALRGMLRRGDHLVATRIEHHAVLHTAEALREQGVEVTLVAPEVNGRVRPEAVAAALRPNTRLVSVMMANNETGVVQPVAEIAALTRAARVPLHVDAVQALGKIEVQVEAAGCDLMSLSAHKIHGPLGAGALYVRRGVRPAAQISGGRQERERRAGTENVPAIAGFGAAAEWYHREGAREQERVGALRDRLERGIQERIAGTEVMGAGAKRVPNTSNICFAEVEGEALLIALDLIGICVSTGAACSSGTVEPSHVLLAMGLGAGQARSCLRFSLGRQNTAAEVDRVLEELPAVVARLRRLAAPLRRPAAERLARA